MRTAIRDDGAGHDGLTPTRITKHLFKGPAFTTIALPLMGDHKGKSIKRHQRGTGRQSQKTAKPGASPVPRVCVLFRRGIQKSFCHFIFFFQ